MSKEKVSRVYLNSHPIQFKLLIYFFDQGGEDKEDKICPKVFFLQREKIQQNNFEEPRNNTSKSR